MRIGLELFLYKFFILKNKGRVFLLKDLLNKIAPVAAVKYALVIQNKNRGPLRALIHPP
jgi:hypothetical protein